MTRLRAFAPVLTCEALPMTSLREGPEGQDKALDFVLFASAAI